MLWALTLIVFQWETSQVSVGITPSAKRELLDSHVCHILTILEGWNLRPWLGVVADWVTNNLSLVNNVASTLSTHDSKSEPSRFQLISCCAKTCQANKDVSLFKLNDAFIDTGFWINESCFTVTIMDSESAHVSVIFLKDMDLLDRQFLDLGGLPIVSFCTHQLWWLICFVRNFYAREILIVTTPSAECNRLKSHLFDILAAL